MGAAKHTPGPWKHVNEHPQNCVATVIVEAAPWQQIATLYNAPSSPQQPAGDGVWPDDPERDANARLIAAAPDLLESLRELTQMLSEWHADMPDSVGDKEPNAMARANAAIAKATGSPA